MMRARLQHLAVPLFFAVLLVLSSACVSHAQTQVNGTITGVITDTSGAAVPGAKVTATDTENKTSQTTTTTNLGVYLFNDMTPATYALSAEKQGFKTCATQGLVLDPAVTRTFNCTLQPGTISETIEVTAGALQVETQTTQINSVINSSQIQQLPDNGRNFANFLALQPGVAGVNFSDFNSMNIFATQGVSVNGLRDQDNNILVEGVSSQRTRDNAAETAAPPVDAIGEINIVSTGYMPEYSRGAGAQIITELKSGTNAYHGSLYEYNQNTDYDSAANFAPGTQGTPRGAVNWNNFGGTVGGPVPKIHNLFFFYSEDVTREPSASPQNVIVPSALAHQGNFSEYCQVVSGASGPAAAVGCPAVPLWLNGQDGLVAFSTLSAAQQKAITSAGGCGAFPAGTPGCFFSGTTANAIPTSLFSPNGSALINVYPTPNLTNSIASGLSNYRYLSESPSNNHTETAKVDYQINPWNSHLAISVRHYRTNQFSGSFGNSPQLLDWNIQEPERGATLDLATTFSPTLINDLTIGSTEDIVHVVLPPGPRGNGNDRSTFGITFPYIFGNASKDVAGKTPTLNWSGVNSNVDSFNSLTDAYPSHSVGHIYQFSDIITKVHGSHTMKFGLWIEKDGETDDDQLVIGGQNLNGQISEGLGTNPFSTGLPLADMLLGVASNYAELGYRNETPWTAWQQGYFAQDSWKVSSRLTIDGGLRWDYLPQYGSSWCNFSMFDPLAYSRFPGTQQVIDPLTGNIEGGNYYNGIVAPCTGLPASGQGHFGVFGEGYNASSAGTINQELVNIGVLHGYSPSIIPNRYRAFQPRLGFAYDPFGTGKTVIRGSAGIFYNHDTLSDQIQMGRNVPFQTGATVTAIDIDCPGVAQNTTNPTTFGCPAGAPSFVPGPVVPSPTNEQSPIPITGEDYKAPLPVVYSYHIGVQRMLPQDTLVEVGYVGTEARHLSFLENLNELPPGTIGDCTLGGGSVSATNPALCAPGSPYVYNNGATAGTATQVATIVPYPGFSNAPGNFTYQEDAATSAYNALQASVQRRMRNNLMFTFVYTYANAHDLASELQSGITDHYDYAYDVGNPDWLAHHTLTATYLYTLPFFKGEYNTFQGRLLGGWELAGVFSFHSGMVSSPETGAFNVNDQGADIAGMGEDNNGYNGGERYSLVAGCNPNSGPRTLTEFFNTSCYAAPAPGTLGDSPRNGLYGPRFWIWDMGLHKNGNIIGEKLQYQFRAEGTNVLNHPIPNNIQTNPLAGNFGQVNGVYTGASPNGDQRVLQLGLRLIF
jgi:hypothetical protein